MDYEKSLHQLILQVIFRTQNTHNRSNKSPTTDIEHFESSILR